MHFTVVPSAIATTLNSCDRNPFLTKTAALRILKLQGVAAKSVEVIRVFNNTVQTTYRTKKSRCSTFLSPKAFTQDFRDFRVEGAKNVQVRHKVGIASTAGTYFECCSSANVAQVRTVRLVGDNISCDCEDYYWQTEQLSDAVIDCKHTIAVASFLENKALNPCPESSQPQVLKTEKCLHKRVIPGLDAVYCPECKETFNSFHTSFEQILNQAEQQARIDLFGEAA